ncbi:MAG: hypothetical protein AMJ78_06545 [Omnitrophica WOR_2 bacterium SM23_29]|nr:MAG: hypothetical protein AMJ78_06545 [Omnitrophica WOR_2 bacterium SM23_29]
MKVSVVICTYGRPEEVKRLLKELSGQQFEDFEVLVICQRNKRDFEEIKDSVKTTYPIKWYYEPEPNLPHARNVGIKETSGEVVIFIDDDVRPSDGLIDAFVSNYSDSSVGMVGGRVLGDKYVEDVPDSKIGKVRKFDAFTHLGFHKDVKCEVMHVKGVNMSVRRDIALEIGGFDERFEGTAECEEMDFCLRVLKKGYKIIFEPKAVVEHFQLSSGGCRVERREEQIYWLYRNHSLAFLKNFNKLFYPILIAEYVIRLILRSLRWRNPKIIVSALRGMRDGLKAYLSKPPMRLW